MGRIKGIIDNRYKEIADRLRSRKNNKDYFNKAKARDSKKFQHHISEFDDCNEIFYIMLEEVRKSAELQIDRGRLFDFFGGHFFIDFGGIDTDGDIPARLVEAADYKRIASILYYAEHHKSYDVKLEEAYSEAIGELFEGILEPEQLLCAKMLINVDTETNSIIHKVAKKLYKEIFDNPELKRKYIIPKDIFFSNAGIVVYRQEYSESTLKRKGKYEEMFSTLLRHKHFLTINECWEKWVETQSSKVKIDNLRFFKCVITPLAGFRYSDLSPWWDKVESTDHKHKGDKRKGFIGDHFILITMKDDVKYICDEWFERFYKNFKPYEYEKEGEKAKMPKHIDTDIDVREPIKVNGKIEIKKDEEDKVSPRTKTIDIINKYAKNDDDVRLLHRTRNLFLQILVGTNNGKTEEDFLKYLL